MKKALLLLVLLFLISGTTQHIVADSCPILVLTTKDKENRPETTATRPRIPSRQNVFCIYEGNTIEIYFRQPEGDAEIEITATDDVFVYEASTSSPIILEVGNLPSQTSIVISTAADNIYYGIIGD